MPAPAMMTIFFFLRRTETSWFKRAWSFSLSAHPGRRFRYSVVRGLGSTLRRLGGGAPSGWAQMVSPSASGSDECFIGEVRPEGALDEGDR